MKSTKESRIVDIKCIKCGHLIDINWSNAVDNVKHENDYDWMHLDCYRFISDRELNEIRSNIKSLSLTDCIFK